MEPNNLILKMPELTKGIYFGDFCFAFRACAQYQYERIYDVKLKLLCAQFLRGFLCAHSNELDFIA